jgi:hypothetical protein
MLSDPAKTGIQRRCSFIRGSFSNQEIMMIETKNLCLSTVRLSIAAGAGTKSDANCGIQKAELWILDSNGYMDSAMWQRVLENIYLQQS